MISLLLNIKSYNIELQELQDKYPKAKIINTELKDLYEYEPVVLRLPEGSFYKNVPLERLGEVISGRGNDMKLQTAGIFNIEMKKYVSESYYRNLIKGLYDKILNIEEYNPTSIGQLIEEYALRNKAPIEDVINPLKMALIKTIKGPYVSDIIYALGKDTFKSKIKSYLENYRKRF